jgi:hypothetical protein
MQGRQRVQRTLLFDCEPNIGKKETQRPAGRYSFLFLKMTNKRQMGVDLHEQASFPTHWL